MNYLTRILAIDIPENTTLVWPPEFTFRGLASGWLIALIVLVLVGTLGVAFFYRLEKGTLGWFRRLLLIGLRCGLLLLLLLLIMRPILLVEFAGERPQGVALVLDNSESMTQRDRRTNDADKARVAIALGKLPLQTPLYEKMSNLPGGLPKDPSRQEIVESVFKHPELNFLTSLKKFGPLRPYFVGNDLRGLSDDKQDLTEKIFAGFKADDSRTALADGIVKILQMKDAEPPSAIVVLTDGQDNASKFTLQEAAQECRRMNVPLHIYGVGSSEGGQLQLKEIGSPDTLFIEDTVAIPVRWRAQGFKVGAVKLKLLLSRQDGKGGKRLEEVVKKEIKLQTGEDLRDVLSFVVPKDAKYHGDQDLAVEIEYKADGVTFKDTLKRTVRVADSKIKILYIEHSPRWEFKFLQPALVNRFEKRCKVDFILVNASKEVANSGPPYLPEFFKSRDKFLEAKYNLIILGDVAESYFSTEQQEWISEFVKNRGGLLVMAGRQNMPGSYDEKSPIDELKSPIARLLPIEFKKEKFGLDAEKASQEYPPTLTEQGMRTDWLALADTQEDNLDVWQNKLLGFHWNYPVVKLRPAATSLIVNPRVKMGEQPMPVLATHLYGKGQVMWLGTDETWRWRWNFQDKYFDRFWGQIIYQLGLPSLLSDSAQRVQMTLDRSKAVVGTQSTIYVRLLDKDFNPRKNEKIEAEVVPIDPTKGEGRKVPVTLNKQPGRAGDYSVLIPHNRAGRFELRVKNPELSTFSFNVDLPPKHEMEEAGLAEKALREAAQISGGQFYREEDLHKLASSIAPHTKPFTHRQEVLLWNPLAILLFLGLITAEWLLRKFSDLS